MKTPPVTMMVWIVAVATAAMLVNGVNGRLVHVGDREGWKPNLNYTTWASQQTFYVGEWIGFWYEKYMYDVIEVNQTGYETCNNEFIIKNITGGSGRDVFQFTEARPYYFICTKGYCYGGMKVAVNVSLPPAPTPAPSPSAAPSLFAGSRSSISVLVLAMTSLVLYVLAF